MSHKDHKIMKNNHPDKAHSHVTTKDAQELYTMAVEAMNARNSITAMRYLERAIVIERVPIYLSSLAFCVAKEKRDFPRAQSLCKEAIKHEPRNSQHFLSLGRIYLLSGQKKEAIRMFRMGLRCGRNQEILRELDRLGLRKDPLIPFLNRSNPINKYLGIMLKKTGLRP